MTPNPSINTDASDKAAQRRWPLYWTEEERGAIAAYIAEHPTSTPLPEMSCPSPAAFAKCVGEELVRASRVVYG